MSENTFGPADLTAPIRILHNRVQPRPDDTIDSYDGFPIGMAASQNIANMNAVPAGWDGEIAHFQWAHRASAIEGTEKGTKPNPISPTIRRADGIVCRVQYSTIAKAMAASKVCIMTTLGYDPAECAVVAADAGFDSSAIVSYADAVDGCEALFADDPNPDATPPYAGEPYHVATDRIILANARIVDNPAQAWGIVYDYEAQDGRSSDATRTHIADLAEVCHTKGFKLLVYTNPLDGAGVLQSGLTRDSLGDVLAAVDRLSILVGTAYSGGNVVGHFRRQLAMLTGPDGSGSPDMAKVFVTFALSSGEVDARQVRRLLTELSAVRMLWYWPDLQTLGGDRSRTVNRVIAASAYGHLMPRPSTAIA
ncbi:hypothetical protein [Pararhizobium mangrovi]|uniref:Uncharacterized protein n=1 Tax=Pararhizobium mangrovi TaxID=2590452 RepID=A0A506UC59_9HYPH|nr:hypothetical protein [Pararhizobium mangrovi]TPW31178.1 hypothetical protein FJU11_02980 [Pararhizobium mangrovi]